MFKQFLAVAPEGIMILNQSFDKVFMNDQMQMIFGSVPDKDLVRELMTYKNAWVHKLDHNTSDPISNISPTFQRNHYPQSRVNIMNSIMKRFTITSFQVNIEEQNGQALNISNLDYIHKSKRLPEEKSNTIKYTITENQDNNTSNAPGNANNNNYLNVNCQNNANPNANL